MMWNWRYRNDLGMQNRYQDKAYGFVQLDRGLDDHELKVFYGLLELRALEPAHGYNVRFALKWSPVIVAYKGTPTRSGHIVVVAGFDGEYTMIDPQGAVIFDAGGASGSWDAKVFRQSKAGLDAALGPQMFYW